MSLPEGTRVGRYEIRALLSAGATGEVYRARDPKARAEVAIRVLPLKLRTSDQRLVRFEQEARSAGRLGHPNILAVYDVGSYEDAPYLVTELQDGSTLRALLERGPLPARIASDYAIQIAHGLAAARDKGITHRDLKPDSLFVTKAGAVKILDFGISKLTQPPGPEAGSAPTLPDRTEPGSALGTAAYLSPEQVRGQAPDHRCDVWALGAILYEMLSGERAFRRANAVDTMSAILSDEPPPLGARAHEVPPAALRVALRCLNKNPDQRFQTARDVAFALDAMSGPLAPAPGPAAGRRALVVRASLLAAAAGLVGLGAGFWLSRGCQ